MKVRIMGCDQAEKISMLIDGELATADARHLEGHLTTCSECSQVRADFLRLRSQISTYASTVVPSLPRPALAGVLSRPGKSRGKRSWQPRWLGVGHAFPKYAAIAAFILIAIAIGTVALLRHRPSHELATNDPPASTIDVIEPSGTEAQLARNPARKSRRVQPRATTPARRKPSSRIKPTLERSAPKPLPQLQNSAPPNYALVNEPDEDPTSGRFGDPGSLTASHFQQSELLLRAFRNLRSTRVGRSPEIAYERKRARQLLYRNIMLRREADSHGDVQVATLLASLEPILLDIANLRDKPRESEVKTIKERVERTSLVPLLQVNAMTVARAND